MKIKLTFKDPDGVYESVQEAVKQSLADLNLEEDEMEPLIETRTEKVKEKLKRWIEYGEYLDVEIDLDSMTAKVLERKK